MYFLGLSVIGSGLAPFFFGKVFVSTSLPAFSFLISEASLLNFRFDGSSQFKKPNFLGKVLGDLK